jgi:antitoxin component of MazEF toxin-antitoxin module
MENKFKAIIWKTGGSYVVSIPYILLRSEDYKKGEVVEITIKTSNTKEVIQ